MDESERTTRGTGEGAEEQDDLEGHGLLSDPATARQLTRDRNAQIEQRAADRGRRDAARGDRTRQG